MPSISRHHAPLIPIFLSLSALLISGCHSEHQEKATQTEIRLRALSMAMALYSNDYEHTLPPTTDMAAIKQCLVPYMTKSGVKRDDLPNLNDTFVAPQSEQEFVFNRSLAGKTLKIEKRPDGSQYLANNKIIFYEPTAEWKNKQRFTVAQDGTIQRFSDTIWPQIKRENGIP